MHKQDKPCDAQPCGERICVDLIQQEVMQSSRGYRCECRSDALDVQGFCIG